jgi:uncharacterized protein YdeI (YjbR/CyaY-like superfamily)
MTPTFFATPAEFRRWLTRHARSAAELWVGFHKKGSGRPSITWPESVDEALCFGWIDGIRKTVDEHSYTNRFTPRRRGSIWSAVNIKRARHLIRTGRMQPAGLRAFKARDAEKSRLYSYERETASLSPADDARFRAKAKAWAFFQSQPPGYRKLAIRWIVDAKREETRARRLGTLIADSARGQRLAPLRRPDAVR